MFGESVHYFRDSLDQTYAFSVWPLTDGDNRLREEENIPGKTYAKQIFACIVDAFGDPCHYDLLDLWLEVYQRPWARPRTLHQLIDELADKVASGELKVYLVDSPVWRRRDSGAVGEGGEGGGSGGDSGGTDSPRTQGPSTPANPTENLPPTMAAMYHAVGGLRGAREFVREGVEGMAGLVAYSHKLSPFSAAREQVSDSYTGFSDTVEATQETTAAMAEDPGKVVDAMIDGVTEPYEDAMARGETGEAIGRGAAELGSMVFAPAKVAQAANATAKASRAARLADDVAASVPNNKPNTGAMQVENISKPKLSPQKVDWNNSGPNGLQVKDPRDFAVGTRMYESLLDKGLEPDLALTISRELLESGISEPSIVKLKQGDKLYKLVPKNGGPPGEHSPYFMTKEMLDELPSEAGDAGSILGLPQVPNSFDTYSITAKTDVEVFQSEIAPFSVNGGEHIRSGGGTQTLVTKRDQFTSPSLLGD